MGGYLAYTEYKDSGVEWLGKIPSHWDVKRLKFISTVQPSNVDKKSDDNEESILLCNYSDVYNNTEITSNLEFMRATATQSEIKKFLIAKGQVIVTKDSETREDIAVPAYVAEDFENVLCGYHLTQIKPENIFGKYIFRLFQSRQFNAQFILGANGVTRFGLPQYIISNAFTTIPPLEEQKSIARFLDYKTAQIDALIAKKEALLEKLAEKRTALISQAVTKGCDPTVPMKDSGIEWLGEIPEHWEVKRLKFVVEEIIDTPHKTAPYDDNGGFLVARTTNVRNGRLLLNDAKFTDEKTYREWTSRAIPEPGDILFTREAPAGEACLVPAVPKLCLGQRMVLSKFDHNRYDGYFLLQSIYSGIADEFIRSLSLGSTVSHFNMSDIGSIPLILPPHKEQKRISFWLSKQISFYDNQIEKVELAIEHLREYRIDVRDIKLPELESVETA